MSDPALTEKDFKAWLAHPVTKAVRAILAAKRADLRNEWEMSDPSAYQAEAFVLANVGNIGWCRGLAFAETIDYEVYLTELNDGNEPKRPGPPRSSGPDQEV